MYLCYYVEFTVVNTALDECNNVNITHLHEVTKHKLSLLFVY